jgi:LPS export ABC transporter protein LptC
MALVSCGRPTGQEIVPSPQAGPDQVMEMFSMDSFVEGKKEWVLSSPRAEVFDKERRIEIQQPFIQFYEQGRPSSTLKAGHGRVDSETRDVWASDGLVMVSTEGVRLESQHMHYTRGKNIITSTAPVTLIRGESRIRGTGWQATPDMSELVILKQKVEVSPEDQRGFSRRSTPHPNPLPQGERGK